MFRSTMPLAHVLPVGWTDVSKEERAARKIPEACQNVGDSQEYSDELLSQLLGLRSGLSDGQPIVIERIQANEQQSRVGLDEIFD